MKVSVGCDLVFLPKFIDSFKSGGEVLMQKLFTPYELAHTQTYESLAGVFAVKEAFIKASQIKLSSWHEIEVYKLSSGKPAIRCNDIETECCDVSISHDGEYAMAVVIVQLLRCR
jgi:phosphopantetheine--protein transferase-like protein